MLFGCFFFFFFFFFLRRNELTPSSQLHERLCADGSPDGFLPSVMQPVTSTAVEVRVCHGKSAIFVDISCSYRAMPSKNSNYGVLLIINYVIILLEKNEG